MVPVPVSKSTPISGGGGVGGGGGGGGGGPVGSSHTELHSSPVLAKGKDLERWASLVLVMLHVFIQD